MIVKSLKTSFFLLAFSIFYLSFFLVFASYSDIIDYQRATDIWFLARNTTNSIFTVLFPLTLVIILIKHSVFSLSRWLTRVSIVYASIVLGLIPFIFLLIYFRKFFAWLDEGLKYRRLASLIRITSLVLLLLTLMNFSFLIANILFEALGRFLS